MIAALIELERTGHAGLVGQLTQQIRALISGGRIPQGTVLPSSRRLANELSVSRNTVTYAFEQLAAEGYLELTQGRSPVVAAVIDRRLNNAHAEVKRTAVHRPKLSPWGSRLAQADWPMSYQAPFRPLRPGHGDYREFPSEIWARCLRRNAVRQGRFPEAEINRPRLRRALREYLAANRGVQAEPGQIFILPSAQAALTLISALLIAPGDRVLTEDPGYPGAAAAFRSAGANVIGMPLDEQGMQRTSGGTAARVIFITPSHHHPTGRLMPVSRRTELLAAAKPGRTWIVEDDYDGEFHYDSRPVPALQGLDRQGRVLYVGTFSKAMTPDIRIGYVVVPAALAGMMEIAQRHLGLIASVQVQDALADFISDGHFLAHIRKVRRIYRGRRDHLADAIERQFGETLSVEVPPGGVHLVARLPGKRNDRIAAQRLVEAGVEVRALSSLALDRPRDFGLLLGFAAWRESEISAAVRTMANVIGASRR
ncbi:MAG: PLP-dependent aminotransferase family protein [Bradyrhizobium icense]|nr:MAG: PLP-dependent aminotransferase family protein [Bradyrhizobium icense]